MKACCFRATWISAGFVWLLTAPPALAQTPLAREDLNAPAPVTAKGWAIADGKTGKLLWGKDADTGFKSASTTKITCALVVLELAEKDPKVMDERITFSAFADLTLGSTADIKAGESLTIRECLYGLMLPSGNDAGNALAEHFNDRLPPAMNPPKDQAQKEGPPKNARGNFIAEMNRTAQRIGLTKTTYRIPYGDGGNDDDRTTTPRDLLTLAHYAMQKPAFRHYVGTRKYEGKVTQPDGKVRTALWENTNQLLGIEGYDGVKTGTTPQAGSCLVASGKRGDDALLVVVLGSESNLGRYVDSRNLFRWAWAQRASASKSTNEQR